MNRSASVASKEKEPGGCSYCEEKQMSRSTTLTQKDKHRCRFLIRSLFLRCVPVPHIVFGWTIEVRVALFPPWRCATPRSFCTPTHFYWTTGSQKWLDGQTPDRSLLCIGLWSEEEKNFEALKQEAIGNNWMWINPSIPSSVSASILCASATFSHKSLLLRVARRGKVFFLVDKCRIGSRTEEYSGVGLDIHPQRLSSEESRGVRCKRWHRAKHAWLQSSRRSFGSTRMVRKRSFSRKTKVKTRPNRNKSQIKLSSKGRGTQANQKPEHGIIHKHWSPQDLDNAKEVTLSDEIWRPSDGLPSTLNKSKVLIPCIRSIC